MAKKGTNSKGGRKKPVQKRRRKRKPIKIKVTAYVMSAVFNLEERTAKYFAGKIPVVFLAIASLIARPYFKERHIIDKGSPVPNGYYCYGIDISRYQADIEWEKLKVLTDAHGRTTNSINLAKDIRNISYVFIKATEGNSLKDKYFKRHWENAGKCGIRRGAYHFFRSSKDAETGCTSLLYLL